eukprot:CAMPEP_0169266856 /NCGR_PEP_ID=MMETSP1016-20121227/46712_1 /TAXON_ID=342587 /ORGANISM="Karlodinium micrum, Strain CCMP2283" /LENGTH=616 /DNA_ID=CAMNT_0009350973 /DNA_START=78 /DNA_END=1928 /DNA_ORIENTATION=-
MQDRFHLLDTKGRKALQSLVLAGGLLAPLRAAAEEVAKVATESIPQDGSLQRLLDPEQLKDLSEQVKDPDALKTILLVAGGAGVLIFILKAALGVGAVFFGFKALEKNDGPLEELQRKFLASFDEPEEFLKIERLNDKLESYAYSFEKATASKTAALRNLKAQSLKRRFGADFASFGLSADSIRKVEKLTDKYEYRDSKLRRKLEKRISDSRANILDPPSNMIAQLISDKFDEAAGLQRERLMLEKEFLFDLGKILPEANASALAEVFAPSFLAEAAGPAGAGSVNAIATLREAFSDQRTSPKHVWVLEFFGDVQASQVKELRKEVTAVIRSADSSRGDEVVLVLNTGGGTVVGYGLAGAQLERIKNAGLRLTICVEQVAASGGYLMACVADEIVAAPFALLGSVGVITEIPNVEQRLTKEGINFVTGTAGKFKRTVTPFKKVTPEDIEKLKADLEDILKIFKNWVNRNRPTLDIDKIATGETWLGPDALDMKLVDRLATLDDVLLDRVDDGAEVFSVKAKEPKKGILELPNQASLKQGLELLQQSGKKGDVLSILSRMLAPRTVDEAWRQSGDTMPRLTERGLGDLNYNTPMKASEPLLQWEERDERYGKTWDGF